MTTSYPSGIDTFTNPAATDTLASPAHHTQHSDANDAIEAIEAELGINPSGSYTDVVSRLAAFVTNVSGTAPITSTGTTTPTIALSLGSGFTAGATLTLNSSEVRTVVGTGTQNGTTYLRGDGTWATPAGGAGSVTNVSGTAPIVSTGGATPAISIDAATPSLPGSMSASDKTKLDTVTAGAKVSNVSGAAPITSTGGATPTVALALGSGFTGGATLTLNSGEARTVLYPSGVGTVTNVSGTAPINSTLGATPTISLTLGSGLQTVSNALTLKSNETRAIIGTSGTPSSTTFLTGDGQWVAAAGTGTVTNVSGTAPISSTGGATPAISIALGSGFTAGAALALNSGEVRTALGTGTQNATTYLRGDATWATPAGGLNLSGIKAGRYLIPEGTTAAYRMANGEMYVAAILIPAACTVDRISCKIADAAGSGGTTRLGIYSPDANNMPGALLLDAGTVDATGTGVKEITISQALSAGWYWLAAVNQGAASPTANLYYFNDGSKVIRTNYLGAANFSESPQQSFTVSGVTGALPANPTFSATYNPVVVGLRLT